MNKYIVACYGGELGKGYAKDENGITDCIDEAFIAETKTDAVNLGGKLKMKYGGSFQVFEEYEEVVRL